MSFRQRLVYFIAHNKQISHKEAKKLLEDGYVQLNGKTTLHNDSFTAYCDIKLKGELISKGHLYKYALYYKPQGVECTLNKNIPGNLAACLPEALQGLYHLGRLDKNSEGLLLLSNDGHLHNKLMLPEAKVPKTYLVETEQPVDEIFIDALKQGVLLSGKPAFVAEATKISDHSFRVVLTQGMNRQIRRMCFKLGNYVTRLVRTGFGKLETGSLIPGEFRWVKREEIL